MSLYFALQTVENNKNKKSVKFQGDMLNFCDFIQVFVFTGNHHLKYLSSNYENKIKDYLYNMNHHGYLIWFSWLFMYCLLPFII